jgi:hypothetical protein
MDSNFLEFFKFSNLIDRSIPPVFVKTDQFSTDTLIHGTGTAPSAPQCFSFKRFAQCFRKKTQAW